MQRISVPTHRRDQMVEITAQVEAAAREAGVLEGWVEVFVPHTTAGITINENADPDVCHDFLRRLDKMVPWTEGFDKHGEGNSAAHVKASMMGSSVRVRIAGRKLLLGRWQGIWFCEFDGPRTRTVWIDADSAQGRS